MRNSYRYIVGLALCALGNIASAGIARDLCADVEKLMENSSSYIRKKAALAAVHIVRKCPDLIDNLANKVRALFRAEKNHGVMVALASLILEMLKLRPALAKEFSVLVPFCCRVLKALTSAGYVAEYDVSGICDPFLQVKLLRMLRLLAGEILAKNDPKATSHITGILAQIATNTESSRNVGNAVLYECVQTIFSLPVEAGLRVLAVNVLGRFLSNTDNNIRYVALNTLQSLVDTSDDGARALQRHKQTIVSCLRDSDITIRRRALGLVYALVDSRNIRPMTRDLLSYLVVADKTFRPNIAAKLCYLIERYAPSHQWRFDMTVRVLTVGGMGVPQEVPASLCKLIAQSPDLHAYAVQRLYALLMEDHTLQSLVIVGLWCFGEFGDMLPGPMAEKTEDSTEPWCTATPAQLLDLIDKFLKEFHGNALVVQSALTCLAKLSSRFEVLGDSMVQQRLRATIQRYRTNINVDVQQRACEFDNLIGYKEVRDDVLERMPPPAEDKDFGVANKPETAAAAPASSPSPAATTDLLAGIPATTTTSATAATAKSGNVLDDLLDLAGPVASTPAAAAGVPVAGASSSSSPAGDVLADLFGPSSSAAASSPAASPSPSKDLPIYNKNGVSAVLHVTHPNNNPHLYSATAKISGATPDTAVSDILLRVAVPKWLKLDLEPASGSVLSSAVPGITQLIKIIDTSNGAVCYSCCISIFSKSFVHVSCFCFVLFFFNRIP